MINQISLANTFGHFVTAVSSLIGLANTLIDGPSFTANTELKLMKPGRSLNVRTNALVSGNLSVQNTIYTNTVSVTQWANISNATIQNATISGGNLTLNQIETQVAIIGNATISTLVSTGGQHTCNTVIANNIFTLGGTANLSSLTAVIATIDNLYANVGNSSITFSNVIASNLVNCTFVGVSGLLKDYVGLNEVDNTSDATKNSAVANLSNKTLMSPLIISGNVADHPTNPLGIASKQYVDLRKEDYGAILNGRMEIWQGGNTKSVTANTQFGTNQEHVSYFNDTTADMFRLRMNSTGAGLTARKSNNVPTFANSGVSFSSSLFITCDEIDPTPNSDILKFTVLETFIETSRWTPYRGVPGVLSFWVYSSKTGNHQCSLYLYTSNNQYIFMKTYPINTANTWEYVTIQVPPETFSDPRDSKRAINIMWGLDSTNTWVTSPLSNNWVTGFAVRDNTTVQPFRDVGAVWAITGVRYDRGETPKTTSWRSLPEELQLCKRYYQSSFALDSIPKRGVGLGTGEHTFIAGKSGGNTQHASIQLPVEMFHGSSIFPTLMLFNPIANTNSSIYDTSSSTHCTEYNSKIMVGKSISVHLTGNTSTSVGNILGFHWAVNSYIPY